MEEISEALDLTKGSLYYYFSSKQELLYFCQQYSLQRLLDEARRIRTSSDPVPVQLCQIIVEQLRCILDELQGSPAHAQFQGLPEKHLREVIQKRDHYEMILRRLVKKGIREGYFIACDPKIVVWAILGAVNWTVQWYSPIGPLSGKQIGEQFASYLVRGLLRPEHQDLLPATRLNRNRASQRRLAQ